METHDEPRNCIDEQTNISSLSIELCCKKMAANYKMTEKQLEVLLNDSKARVLSTLGGVILINTTNEKQLALAIVEEVKHYFGEPKNKPKNTAAETLILSRADVWLQGIKSSTHQTPRQYANFVVERTRHDYSTGTGIETTSSFEEIIKAVEAWADKKREQPAPAQPLIDDQPDNSHFNAYQTKEELKTIFDKLKDGRYLPADSVLQDWLIVCGAGTSNEPTKPLNWLKAQNLLGWLIHVLFVSDLKRWDITKHCFTVKGKTPNTNSMKTDVSKIENGDKDKPKSFEELECLLRV